MRTHTETYFARCVSAEIRARIGAGRYLNQQLLGAVIGRSQNYISERLRDVKPFTLDDLGRLLAYFNEPERDFFAACERHGDVVYDEMVELDLWPRSGSLLGQDDIDEVREAIEAERQQRPDSPRSGQVS